MKGSKFFLGLFALAALALGGSGAALAKPGATTCSGGTLAPGVYDDLKVTGNCKIDGMVIINGNVTVENGANLDAAWSGTHLTIDGNVKVGKGATLGLGCADYYHDCGIGHNWLGAVVVNGNIDAKDALTMYLDYTIVLGNVNWHGGGGIAMGDSGPGVDDGLVNAIKDNVIGGNLNVDGWAGAWFGVIRNTVFGNVTVAHTVGNRSDPDPDSTEIVTNIISGNLNCRDNSPPAQIGDSGGTPNSVSGKKSGECAGL
jgi:hypothetical protein